MAVRPPEFFPRISYFGLLAGVDRFMLGDRFAYSRQSHQNRTPIRRPEGRMWLTLPVEAGSKGRPVSDVKLSETEYDPGKLWRAIRFNYEATPFFMHFQDELRDLLYNSMTLGEMTCRSVELLAGWLRIRTPIERLSSMTPDAMTLRDVAPTVNGCYVAAEESCSHDSRLIPVAAVGRFEPPVYQQAFEGFEPDLSALDALFNLGPDAGHLIEASTVLQRLEDVGEGSVKPGACARVD